MTDTITWAASTASKTHKTTLTGAEMFRITDNGTSSKYTTAADIVGSPLMSSGIWLANSNGLVADGTTDNTSALNTLLSTVQAAGGGLIMFGPGVYLFSSNITLPNDGATPRPNQKSMGLIGCGMHDDGSWAASTPLGGTVLAFTSPSGTASILTLGNGHLTVQDLTIRATANTALPFLMTTNTTIRVFRTCFFGYNSGSSANNDAVVFGGTDTTVSGGSNAPFQGYGSVVDQCYFARIRRAGLLRTYCNNTVMSNCTISTSCGWSDAHGAPFHIIGDVTNTSVGNIIRDCTVETVAYAHAVRLGAYAQFNSVMNVNAYDNTGLTSLVYAETATSTYNMIIGGLLPNTVNAVLSGTQTNWVVSIANGTQTNILGPTTFVSNSSGVTEFTAGAVLSGSTGLNIVRPATAQSAGSELFSVRRSSAEATDSGAIIFSAANNGALSVGSANTNGGGNIANSVATGAAWTSNGRTWAAQSSGGNMLWDSGSGGSYNSVKGYAFRFQDFNGGNYVATFSKNASGLSNKEALVFGGSTGANGDTGIYRASAGQLCTLGVVSAQQYTVATLPTAASGLKGYSAVVTDGAAAIGFRSAVSGGGSTAYNVICDGSSWLVD